MTTRLATPLKLIPRSVWALGLVSLFMDMSSEWVHGLLPIFLTTTLGASAVSLGLIEGLAEATASIVKLFSGNVSDRWGNRKGLALAGYGLAALTKPVFPMAHSVIEVTTARCIDRIGKGIRGAPRDALVAEVSPPEILGAAVGLRQALDTVGAVIGPLIAIGLMMSMSNDIRQVLWFAFIPSLVALVILFFGVQEPVEHKVKNKRKFYFKDLVKVGRPVWILIGIGSMMTLARFSEAFLVLQAQRTGLPLAWAPMALVVMSTIYAVSAYPFGALSDRTNRRTLLILGLAVLVGADVCLAASSSIAITMAGISLWGLHLGMTQGLMTTLIAEEADPAWKANAYGAYGLVTGVLLLFASALAGWLWQSSGPAATFWAGAIFAMMTMILLLVTKPAMARSNAN